MDPSHLKKEPGLVQSVKSEAALLVKEDITEDSGEDGNDRQCVQGLSTPVNIGSLNEACSTSLSDLIDVKNEQADMDIGSTVFQHMDIHYTNNKTMSAVKVGNTIADDGNEAVPCSGGKQESVEDKLRDDNDKTHKKFFRGQQKDRLHQAQHLTIGSNGFKCDRPISRPHLLSVHNKLQQRNSRNISMITVVASHQTRDKTAQTKQKLDVRAKEYSSKAVKFTQTGDFTKQIKVHTGEKPYQCDTCDARFSNKCTLVKHRRVHTSEKPYQCDTCDSRFLQKCTLVHHRRVHTREKPYQCDACDTSFAHKSNLVQHMRVHTRAKPYQCDTCDARFAQKSNLVHHRRVHTGEKPYQCDVCDASFARKYSLVRHMRVHTGEKPYQCDACDASFAQKSNLVHHRRVHTGEKPYQCDALMLVLH